ncbi:MAG: acetylglutamate kinase [Tannerellaceae bacterium]|jgi:acetylglutamate kinase|nr:acetylglutamate kinase [Tannerellaceae bacterium]
MKNNPLTVIKVGGRVIEEDQPLELLLTRFAAVAGPKILVHGGGRSATTLARQLGIETHMVDGRRITDLPTLRIAAMVYGGWINKSIVARLQARGIDALGVTGADMDIIRSERRPVREIDYGYVGDVTHVRADIFCRLIEQGHVPVIAPLTHDGHGSLLNTNADTIAAETAIALASFFDVTLIYCFEERGVLRNPADPDSVIDSLTPDSFRHYVDEGVISGGMIPKLENAFRAITAGVVQVQITNPDNLSPLGISPDSSSSGTRLHHSSHSRQ